MGADQRRYRRALTTDLQEAQTGRPAALDGRSPRTFAFVCGVGSVSYSSRLIPMDATA
jgi:hypothetical protein